MSPERTTVQTPVGVAGKGQELALPASHCWGTLPRLAHHPRSPDFQILPCTSAYGISGFLSRRVSSTVLRRTKLGFVLVSWVLTAAPISHLAVLEVTSLEWIGRAELPSYSSV